MRKANGLFNRVCEFVNSRPPGTTYKTSELTAWCKGYEHVTSHKQRNSNPFYRTLTYQTQLKYSGIVSHVKRGEWRVDLRIPDWFTISHAETVAGYDTYVKRKDSQGSPHWIGVSRTKMTKAEILAGLLAYQTEKHADAWAKNSKAKQIFTAMENAFTTTYAQGYYRDPIDNASVDKDSSYSWSNGTEKASITVTPTSNGQDPLCYASAAAKMMAKNNDAIYACMQKTEAEALAQFTTNADTYAQPTVTVEKITREESKFFKTEDSVKERNQLIENLRESIGLLEAATIIIDRVQILDPLVQGRVVNIYEQLKAITKTVGSRIEYNRTKQII